MESRDLQDRVALVTGASRGIGAAIAARLGQTGARVVGTATSAAGAEQITRTLAQAGVDGRGEVLDVGVQESVAGLMTRLADAGDKPTILVNNAGITRDQLLLRMREADWDDIINVNLSSVYRLSKACLRGMMKARYGRIISIASVVGLSGNPGQANYAAAKAGMIGFSKSLAREVGTRGVTVNVVAPGFIQTDMTAALDETQRETLAEQVPLGRLGDPEDIAAAVAYLAGPGGAYITGETLHVNGGMYMA